MKIYEDTNQKNAYLNDLQTGKNKAVQVVAAWNKLPMQKIKTVEQIRALFDHRTNLNTFAAAMLPDGGKLTLLGVTLRPERVVELMELDYTELNEALLNINTSALFAFLEVAEFNYKGLEISKAKLNAALERFTVNAVTEREKQIAINYLKIVEGMNALADLKAVSMHRFFNAPYTRIRDGKMDIEVGFYRQMVSSL